MRNPSTPLHLMKTNDHVARFMAELNQALALKEGGSLLMPRTQEELDARNAALAAMQASEKAPSRAEQSRQVHNSLMLPDYARWLQKERRK